MELAFIIYLIDNITSMKGSFWDLGDMAMLFLCIALASIFALMLIFVSTDTDFCNTDIKELRLAQREKYLAVLKNLWKNTFFWTLPFFIVGSILNNVLPSKDTAYKMIAAYGLQETVEAASKSEDVKRLANKSLTLIEKSIDEYSKSLDTKSLDNKDEQEDNSSTEGKKD